jgi:uncharacterized membrane protein
MEASGVFVVADVVAVVVVVVVVVVLVAVINRACGITDMNNISKADVE